MLRLFSLLYAVIGTTMAGIVMIVALATGYDTLQYVVSAVVVGFLVGVPVTWLITKKLINL